MSVVLILCHATLVSVLLLALGTIVWLRHSLRKRGILGPRCASHKEMLGWREIIGLATTHYAIFSSKGVWGQGELDPERLVVYIHGMGAHLGQLTWGVDGGLAHSLVESGYTVLAVDLYGHGFSDAPDSSLSPNEFVEQLHALLTHLKVDEPFDLIGFSHGCFIASAYSASKSSMVKHLALTSPFGCDLPCHSWKAVAGFAALIVHLTFDGNLSQIRTIYRVILHLEGYRLPYLLKSIDSSPIEVLILAGAWDCDPAMRILQTARNVHASLPKSQLHVIPAGMHMTWAAGTPDQQRDFRVLIVSFLGGSESVMGSHGPEVPLLGGKGKHIAIS